MQLNVDGHAAFVYTGGRPFAPGQPSMVFVHGGGLDHSVWILQSRYFAHHGYNVLAVDLPAHGRSGGPPLSGIPAMADWCARVLDAAGVASAAVVGHSMGSLVALEFGARHPGRAWLLGLIGISTPMPVTDRLLDAARNDEHAAFDMVNIWGHDLSAQIGGNQAPGMWMTGGAIRLLERSGSGVLHNDLDACNRYLHGPESAAKVRCHAHLLIGERDIMATPVNARELRASLASLRVTVLPRCGHMLMAERPGEVLDALIDSVSENTPALPQSVPAA